MRRPLALALAVAVVLLALPVQLALVAAPAGATGPVSTAADGAGNYGYCNVQKLPGSATDNSGNTYYFQDFKMKCNVSTVQFGALTSTNRATDGFSIPGAKLCEGTTAQSCTSTTGISETVSGGVLLDTSTAGVTGRFHGNGCCDYAGSTRPILTNEPAMPADAWRGGADYYNYQVDWTICDPSGHMTMRAYHAGTTITPDFQFGCTMVSSAPDWPSIYWTGGAPGAPPAAAPLAAPSYQCQRTLNSSGGGWSATFSALGPFGSPTPAPTTVSEAWSGGFLSAPLTGNTPAAQTVPTPAPVGGWVVTWTGKYTLPADDASHAYAWNVGAQDALRQLLNGATSWTPTSAIGQTLNSQQLHDLLAGGSTTGATWTASGHTATLSAVGAYGDLAVSVDGTSYGTVLASFTSSGTSTTAATFRVTTTYGIGGYALPNAVTGASFGSDPRTLTLSCAVLVDLSQPNTGVQATVQPPNSSAPPSSATDPPAGSGSGSCSAGPLGSIPLIGGALDATAQLVCAMGDMLGRLLNGLSNLFLSMFVPSSASIEALKHLWDTVTTKAPFSIIVSVVSFIPTTTSAFASGVSNDHYDDGSEKCPTIELNPAGVTIPGAGPTHTTCIAHDSGSDLNLLRGILLALFAVSIALAVVKTTQRVVNGG